MPALHRWLPPVANSEGFTGAGPVPSLYARPFMSGRFTRSHIRPGPENFTRSNAPKGKSRHAAIRALAFKWIRVLFRCWKERKPYDELVYQRVLSARRPRRPENKPVELGWKNVAGFNKIVIAGA